MEYAKWHEIPITLANHANATDGELQQACNWLKDNNIPIKYGDGIRFRLPPRSIPWGQQACLWNGTGLEKIFGLKLPLDTNPLSIPFPVIDEGKCRDGIVRKFPVHYWSHSAYGTFHGFSFYINTKKYREQLIKNITAKQIAVSGWWIGTAFKDGDGQVHPIIVRDQMVETEEQVQKTINWMKQVFSSDFPLALDDTGANYPRTLMLHNYANIDPDPTPPVDYVRQDDYSSEDDE